MKNLKVWQKLVVMGVVFMVPFAVVTWRLISSVNEGMQAQSTGAQQISDALAQLGEAARQTAESLRGSSLAIEELNGASQGLKTSVERFKLA